MKKILLLGDSIRQSYQEYVHDKLLDANIGNVYYPNDSGKFSLFTLRYLHDWIRILSNNFEFNFDIVHINCGLWDVLRLTNDNETITSEKDYEKTLSRIFDRIKYYIPNGKIIFALTTPIIEPGFINRTPNTEHRTPNTEW